MVPDLRGAALREAEAVAATRELRTTTCEFDHSRPVITKMRRRTRRASRTWAVRLLFADRHGCVRWTTILGLRSDAPFHRHDVRRAVDTALLDSTLEDVGASQRTQLLDGAERFALTAIAREDEILAGIHAFRQRLVPVSRGLFDRRHELAASVQAEMLTDAARQCERQKRHLSSLLPLTVCGSELAFALVSE